MTRVLITGGTGYVGGRFAQFLEALGGHEIVIGSRHTSNLDWLQSSRLTVMNWESQDNLRQACVGIDTIFHFAALNDEQCRRDPVAALTVNGLGTARLLAAAAAEQVARFVYLSTSQVYGSQLAGSIDERTLPRPQNAYATSHRAAEDCVLNAHDTKVLLGVVVRLSNGFGYPMHRNVDCWRLLVNDLCRQAVTTGRLTLKTHGLQLRNFVPMDDAVRALHHVSALSAELLGDGLFNLGGRTTRVLDMANVVKERCAKVLGIDVPIERPTAPTGAAPDGFEYSSKKLQATGFAPRGQEVPEIDATLRLCRTLFA